MTTINMEGDEPSKEATVVEPAPWDGRLYEPVVEPQIWSANADWHQDHWAIGIGDYANEGEPDLLVYLDKSAPREQVEWVARALMEALHQQSQVQPPGSSA